MLQQLYTHPHRIRQLLSEPLGVHLGAFVEEELSHGFARLTLREHIRVLGKLNHWLQRRGVRAEDVTSGHLRAFVEDRRRRERPRRDGHDFLHRFLHLLQARGVARAASPVKPRANARGRVLVLFADYLTRMRGLSPWTIRRYTYLIRPFVKAHFSCKRRRWRSLRPRHVYFAVTETAHLHGRGRARDLVAALRCFLRWLQSRGDVDSTMAASVPAVATWRLRGVPPILSESQVRRVLRTCDLRTAMGRRDYAILLLLARLGLRASEIVSLRLEDLDWREGTLRIMRKGGKVDSLPMPPDVGRALVGYLRSHRPPCGVPRVFLCMSAPYRGLGHSSTVSSMVTAALRRAELTPARRGAHLLRHTLASHLLRRGACLSDIGQLLGHRSPASTEVYAKVDMAGLRTVAQPWPGGAR